MSEYLAGRRCAPTRILHHPFRTFVSWGVAALLTACGGGDGPGTESASVAGAEHLAAVQSPILVSALEREAGWVTLPPVSTVDHGPSKLPATGRVFYVDSASTAATSAGTLNAPWKTLKEVQSQWSSFQNGDAILLKCGSVWRETLDIGATTVARPDLLLGAYGECSDTNRPVIKGSVLVDKAGGWTRFGKGFNYTYVKSVTLPASVTTVNPKNSTTGEVYPRVCDDQATPQPVAGLFLDGQPLTQARFPNPADSATGSEYVPLENDRDASGNPVDIKTFFRMRLEEMNRLGLKKTPAPKLEGAIVHIRTEPWEIETRVVQAFDASTGLVTLDKPTKHVIKHGSGYILEGKAWFLAKPGQWAYESGKLYWWPLANKAPKDVVGNLEASHIEAGILARRVNGLKVERIRFEQHRRTGVDFSGDFGVDKTTGKNVPLPSSDITLTDVQAVHAGGCGLSSVLGDKLTVQDSQVVGAGRYGLHINPTTNAVVRRNLIMDTGLYGRAGGAASGMTVRSFTKDFPLDGRTSVSRVEENVVVRSANTGIFFSNDVGTTVHRNTVLRPCVRLTDCGGIYSFTNYIKDEKNPTAELQNILDPALLPDGATVTSNLVVGARSNLDGSYIPARQEAKAGTNQAVGIYLDELSARAKIRDNTVANTEVGIYLHLARFNTIENNTVLNVSFASFMAAQGANVNGYRDNTVQGNQVLNNRFFSVRGVDAAQLPKTDRVYYDYDKPVYAQLWQSTQASDQTFFSDVNGPANISRGNVTYTTANVQNKTWRTNGSNLLVASHGGAWGVRQSGKVRGIEQLNLEGWQQRSGATGETERSPVAFKQFLLAQTPASNLIQNGSFLTDASLWYQNNTFLEPKAKLTQLTSSPCSPAVPCGLSEAFRGDDFLASKAFALTANELYLLRYTIRAGDTGALYRANIRNSNVTSGNYALQGFNFLNRLDMAPGQQLQIEQFFRAMSSSTDAVLSMIATDGTKDALKKRDIYVSEASLTPISATAMPIVRNPSAEAVTLVNASDVTVTRTCSGWQLDGANGCQLIDGETREVIGPTTSVTLPARSAKLFFFHKPEWLDN